MVKLAHNPFTPTFGCVPPELAGRDTLITDILEGLDNAPGDPNRATIFVGARGTGKTVLLTAVAERAEMRGVGQRQCNRPIRNALGDNRSASPKGISPSYS